MKSLSRRGFVKILWEQKAHALLGTGILALYTALGFIRDDLLPFGVDKKWWDASVQSHLTVLDLLGDFSWLSCAVVALFIALLLGFEASYRLQVKNLKEFVALEGEIDRLVRDATPTIALSVDPPRFVLWMKKSGASERTLLLSVANVGGVALDDCQVKLSYHSTAEEPRPNPSRYPSCSPFSLVPDDSTRIPVLKAKHDRDAGDDYLGVISYVNDKGTWRESDVTPLIGAGTWRITVVALSRSTRRASLEFIVRYTDSEWEVVDVPA